MITFRTRLFIIASVVVLLILAVSLALIVFRGKTPLSGETPEESAPISQIEDSTLPAITTAPPPTAIPNSPTVKPLTNDDIMKNSAKQMAKIFIERYGTYSSENNGENIKECQALVTESLWSEISKRIGVQPASGIFTGATTKAIAVDLAEYEDEKAKAELGVMRTVTKGDDITEQSARANVWLIKSGDSWLVDKFEWLQ